MHMVMMFSSPQPDKNVRIFSSIFPENSAKAHSTPNMAATGDGSW